MSCSLPRPVGEHAGSNCLPSRPTVVTSPAQFRSSSTSNSKSKPENAWDVYPREMLESLCKHLVDQQTVWNMMLGVASTSFSMSSCSLTWTSKGNSMVSLEYDAGCGVYVLQYVKLLVDMDIQSSCYLEGSEPRTLNSAELWVGDLAQTCHTSTCCPSIHLLAASRYLC